MQSLPCSPYHHIIWRMALVQAAAFLLIEDIIHPTHTAGQICPVQFPRRRRSSFTAFDVCSSSAAGVPGRME